MALTGRRDGPPLGPPVALLPMLDRLSARLGVDAYALLGERAGLLGLTRNGDVSCGGATRLLPTALRATGPTPMQGTGTGPTPTRGRGTGRDWVAVSMARPSDWELVPAWLAPDVATSWDEIAAVVATRPAGELVQRGALLGLPIARLGESTHPGSGDEKSSNHPHFLDMWRDLEGAGRIAGVTAHPVAGRLSPTRPENAVVVDLSALWAGPLCARLLHGHGARVITVESAARPDGARRTPEFYERLYSGHESVVLDLSTPSGLAEMHALVRAADVVIEASRPRALRQLGVVAEEVGAKIWVSITGHGRDVNRVAFGDDAAVAGGLVVYDDRGPCFVADAVADPLTGMVAAVGVLDLLPLPGAWLLDVPMAAVAAAAGAATLRRSA